MAASDPRSQSVCAFCMSASKFQVTVHVGLLQRTEESDEVVPVLSDDPRAEALVVEIDHLAQIGGRSVVEVRSARGQAAQDRALELADVGELARDERSA